MPTKLLLIYPHKPWCFPCVHMFCLTISTSKTILSRRGLDSELSLLLQKLKCLAGSRGIAPWIKGVLRFNLCEYVYEYVYHFILSYHILSCRILSCRILSYLSVYLSEFVYLSIYPLICKYKLEIEGIKVFFFYFLLYCKSLNWSGRLGLMSMSCFKLLMEQKRSLST
jgi:hypothetical protein